MSDDKQKCQHVTYKNWHQVRCDKPAKMEHNGKHYCGIHDPVKRKQRSDEKQEEWRAEWAAKKEAEKAAADRQAQLEREAELWRTWMPYFDRIEKVPFNLAKDISAYKAAIAAKQQSGEKGNG